MKFKTVVIDDSNVQRMATSFLVKQHEELELIGDYSDPIAGIEAAITHGADLLILDVLYESFTAFDFLDNLDENTGVILNSAWAEYANRARNYPLTEFILKPMKRSTFAEAVDSIILEKLQRSRNSRIMGWV